MRLVILAHGGTSATRSAAFADDEALDERGRDGAARLAGRFRRGDEIVRSPARRCRETAELALPTAPSPTVEPALAGPDHGRWAGRDLADVAATDPEGLRAWMGDVAYRGHGGESLADLVDRVGTWMDARCGDGARVVLAVVDPPVVRAAIVHATGAALWRVDVAPLTVATLTGDGVRWNLRSLRPALPTPDDELVAGDAASDPG